MKINWLALPLIFVSVFSAAQLQPKVVIIQRPVNSLTEPAASVALSCSPPATGTPAQSFNLYRATGVCTVSPAYSLLESSASCAFNDTTVQLGLTYCYVATALDIPVSGTCPSGSVCESGYSNQASASIPSAPTITAISPPSGIVTGGTSVTISGTTFVSGATVLFGSAPATGVTVNGSTQITAISPAGALGTVSVTVTNPNGLNATLASAFTYTQAAPNPPTGLTVGTITANNVPLTWQENGKYTYFSVWRKGPTKYFKQIAVGIKVPDYTNTGLPAGSYSYEVKAIYVVSGKAYISSPSNVVNVVIN